MHHACTPFLCLLMILPRWHQVLTLLRLGELVQATSSCDISEWNSFVHSFRSFLVNDHFSLPAASFVPPKIAIPSISIWSIVLAYARSNYMTVLQASEANRVKHFPSNTRDDSTHPASSKQRLCTAVWLSQIRNLKSSHPFPRHFPLCNLDKVPAIRNNLVDQLC